MTQDEFYNEFNLFYNNIASNQAPGLDRYEISVYLTKAENALTDALYGEFEKSEEARRKLAPLVNTVKLSTITVPANEIIYPNYTTTFKPLDDVRYIINEQVVLGNTGDRCTKNAHLKVQPCLHDEVNDTINNPYKFNNKRALRLDTSVLLTGEPYIEILTKVKPIEYYQIRYVKNPDPIILGIFSELIDGKANDSSTTYLGSLPDFTHRQIVEIAAKLAYADYKQ